MHKHLLLSLSLVICTVAYPMDERLSAQNNIPSEVTSITNTAILQRLINHEEYVLKVYAGSFVRHRYIIRPIVYGMGVLYGPGSAACGAYFFISGLQESSNSASLAPCVTGSVFAAIFASISYGTYKAVKYYENNIYKQTLQTTDNAQAAIAYLKTQLALQQRLEQQTKQTSQGISNA